MRNPKLPVLLSLLLAGCASTRETSVREMGKAYRAGETRFEDFKRDARLVEVNMLARSRPQYAAKKGSPFTVRDDGISTVTFNDKEPPKTHDFIVEDNTGAMCVLQFSVPEGKLVDFHQYK